MNKAKVIFFVLIFTNIRHINSNIRFALTINPVVDLLGQSMQTIYPQDYLNYYNLLPLSPLNKKNIKFCPRIHQLLFNEVVIIVEENSHEFFIETPHVFYQLRHTNKKNNRFCTLKKNFITFEDLLKKNIDINKIPKPINFNQNNNQNSDQNIITLTHPYYDSITKKEYSAGTRFVQANKENNSVYIFNPKNFLFNIATIPKNISISNNIKSNKVKILNFVNLIRDWANQKNGYIPYVWGGCSFCYLCTDEKFKQEEKTYQNQKIKYFALDSYKTKIKCGFDCARLIKRAAQICSIPFFFSNTTSISKNLKSLKSNESIVNGDLIWFPGHIIIISDINKNLCVEARDYSHGYGKIHEISINKLFKNIHTIKQLRNKYINHEPLTRLDANGNIIQITPSFKILKLESVWK